MFHFLTVLFQISIAVGAAEVENQVRRKEETINVIHFEEMHPKLQEKNGNN